MIRWVSSTNIRFTFGIRSFAFELLFAFESFVFRSRSFDRSTNYKDWGKLMNVTWQSRKHKKAAHTSAHTSFFDFKVREKFRSDGKLKLSLLYSMTIENKNRIDSTRRWRHCEDNVPSSLQVYKKANHFNYLFVKQ